MDHPIRTSVRSDRIGKVFCVLDRDMRQCLICDGLFTRQAAPLHSVTACFPSQRSFELVRKTNNANR